MGLATEGRTTCVSVRLMNPHPVEAVVNKGSRVAVVEELNVTGIMAVPEESAFVPKTLPISKEKQEMLW